MAINTVVALLDSDLYSVTVNSIGFRKISRSWSLFACSCFGNHHLFKVSGLKEDTSLPRVIEQLLASSIFSHHLF